MKMYLDFGDYSCDGHGQKERIVIEAPSEQHLIDAQRRIKNYYGSNFFTEMADDYLESYFSETVWKALIETNYPIQNLKATLDGYDLDGLNSIEEFLKVIPNPVVNIELVIDAFIWLLNFAGAEIAITDEVIPCINWNKDFETVGYGCFV